MQPNDSSRHPSARRVPPPPPNPVPDPRASLHADGPDLRAPPRAELRLAAPAMLIEARFRELTLATRLLRADEAAGFTIGPARGADAPVNPAYLAGPGGHLLVEPVEGGFALHLAPAMRAELQTEVQRLPLLPDQGRAEAPLVLPPQSWVRVPCGEMTFELRAAEPAAAVPRPWLPARWRQDGRYLAGVALAVLALIVVVRALPEDPRALSLDDLGASHHWARWLTIPVQIDAPEPDRALTGATPGGAGAPAAAGPTGQAGDRKAPDRDRRSASKGPASPSKAVAAAKIRANPMLAMLDGPRTGALHDVLADGPALGGDAEDALGHLVGTTIGDAYGRGGLSVLGTGEGGGGTHERMLGGGGLGTIGAYGGGIGSRPGYGRGVGPLGRHIARVPDPIPGDVTLRGALDKEIIRRIVRRHINEVRYCYEQALVGHPSLGGRVVVQFTIAGTGRVLASVLQSSSLGSPAVESCVVTAVKRWEFPQPQGGGLVIVSYPFQLTPAGGG